MTIFHFFQLPSHRSEPQQGFTVAKRCKRTPLYTVCAQLCVFVSIRLKNQKQMSKKNEKTEISVA